MSIAPVDRAPAPLMCFREPCPQGTVLSPPKEPSDFSIETTPFPSISPLVFLAQAIGNVAGSFVNPDRGGNQPQQPAPQFQMPDVVEMMQREETNRLIKELLRTSKDKKDKFTMELDLKKPGILGGEDSFSLL